jgi:hypothetical protein
VQYPPPPPQVQESGECLWRCLPLIREREVVKVKIKIGKLSVKVTLQPTRVGSTRRWRLSGPCTFDGGGGYCPLVLPDFQSASTNCNYIYTILNAFCQPPFLSFYSNFFIAMLTHSVISITLFWGNRRLTDHTIYQICTDFLLMCVS